MQLSLNTAKERLSWLCIWQCVCMPLMLGLFFVIILHIFLLFKVILMPLIAVKSLSLPLPMCAPCFKSIIMTAMAVISLLLLHVLEHIYQCGSECVYMDHMFVPNFMCCMCNAFTRHGQIARSRPRYSCPR